MHRVRVGISRLKCKLNSAKIVATEVLYDKQYFFFVSFYLLICTWKPGKLLGHLPRTNKNKVDKYLVI